MEKYKFASIDIGGTNVRFALINNKEIIKKIKFDTDTIDYKKTLNYLIDLINEYEINAIALCIPGPADYKKGVILSSPNLTGWNGINIKKYLMDNCPNLKHTIFENDANAMALANHYTFKNQPNEITQFFTISTGFGAGLVIDDKIYTGSTGYAQEIARIPVSSLKSNPHHLNEYASELFISGTGLSLQAKDNSIVKNSKEILESYGKDEILTKIIDSGIDSLARTISTIIGFLNPSLIVFGGSVAVNNWWFVEKAINKAETWTDIFQWKSVRFEKDLMGDDSALYGLDFLIKDYTKHKNNK